MEKKKVKKQFGRAFGIHLMLFFIYLLFVMVDGGLCLAYGRAATGRTVSIVCCILLSGVPLLCAGWFTRCKKASIAISLIGFSGLFAVCCGCMMGSGYAASSILSVNLLVYTLSVAISVVALTAKKHGINARGCERFLLSIGIISVVVSFILSLFKFSPSKSIFVGLSLWTKAFDSVNPISGILRFQGSLGWMNKASGSGLALYPLSSGFSIFMLWRTVKMATSNEHQGSENLQYLKVFKTQNPAINPVRFNTDSYEYLETYKRNH